MRAQTERGSPMMANPRRIVYLNSQSSDNPFQIRPSFLASLLQFLQKPHSLPFLLSIFLFLTWISIRFQRVSQFSTPPAGTAADWSVDDDMKANLVRFSSGIPSQIAKDKRGWLLDPVSLALASGISGGAVSCASVHVGEIRPGKIRGNHRHHNCNETFVIWGAATKFRILCTLEWNCLPPQKILVVCLILRQHLRHTFERLKFNTIMNKMCFHLYSLIEMIPAVHSKS
ncbi:uncharacterized protein LOC114729889 isoform X2 [Neltuma alba]|uniref:uncharacterized protein LOC114729889 isoform X2 n=1 Tax=Neltuma alba TaxID=207710 RepID=UPI0010A538E5|nr:uncharacterized protein LOC114729889 isoform X2 [Prosopis alba]